MKTTTVRITEPAQLVGFIKSIGTECNFVSMRTETEVKMRKTGNPFYGAVKVSRRNGLVNVNFVKSVERRLKELTGVKTSYTPGQTWYVHDQTIEGNPLPLCVHKKDNNRFYLQYFPHRTLGSNSYFLNGRQLTPAEVEKMKSFVIEDTRPAHKPTVITLAIDSIRELKARKVTALNNTVSKIAGVLAEAHRQ